MSMYSYIKKKKTGWVICRITLHEAYHFPAMKGYSLKLHKSQLEWFKENGNFFWVFLYNME